MVISDFIIKYTKYLNIVLINYTKKKKTNAFLLSIVGKLCFS